MVVAAKGTCQLLSVSERGMLRSPASHSFED